MSEEFDFFGDPRIGKLFDLVLQLASELHVTNQRLRALEALLVRGDVLAGDAVDGFLPGTTEQQSFDRQRDEYLGRLMRIVAESGPSERPLRDQWEAAVRRPAL